MFNKKHIRILAVGIVILSLFFSIHARSKALEEYHYLSDNQTQSEHYEIKKLIHGQVDAILYHKPTQTTLVFADNYLWKINSRGYVTDTYRGTTNLYDSGLQLRKFRLNESDNRSGDSIIEVNDWIHSGNKSDHKIMKLQSLKNVSEKDLISRLNSAIAVEFLNIYATDNKEIKVALVQEGFTWTAFDLGQRFGELDDHFGRVKIKNMTLWNTTSLQGYKKKYTGQFEKLSSIIPLYHPEIENINSVLHIKKFDKQFYYFEEGFLGWLKGNVLGKTIFSGWPGELPVSYWYGTGFFEIKHNSETLRFKAFTSTEDKRFNLDNFSMYSPPVDDDDAIKLIRIAYKGGEHNYYDRDESLLKHHEKDVGLYVLRKKLPVNTVDSIVKWTLKFAGEFASYKFMDSIWGDITFLDSKKTSHYMISDVFAYSEYPYFPKSLSVHWKGPDVNALYKLHIDDSNSIWLDFRRYADVVTFQLELDETEIRHVFAKLNAKHGVIKLIFDVKKIDETAGALLVTVQNNKQRINLEKIRYSYNPPEFKDNDNQNNFYVTLEKLKIEFDQAMSDSSRMDDFLIIAKTISEQTPVVDDHISATIKYSVDLFMSYMKARDYKSSNEVIQHFLIEQAPKIRGAENKHINYNKSVFASQGLVLSQITKNEKLAQQIFDELLGNDFKIGNQINATLLYNMACYYAIHDKKEAMLEAMGQAIALGKSPEQFKSDTDFKDFQDDKEFIRVLNSKVILSPEVIKRLEELSN